MPLKPGDKAACIHSSLRGTVLKLLGNGYVLLLDDDTGMELDYPESSLVKIEAGAAQLTAKNPQPKEASNHKGPTSITLDLHTEKLPQAYKTTPPLQGQLDYFDYKTALAIRQGVKKITIIHGRGKGALKSAITQRLKALPQVKTFYDPEKVLALKDSKLVVELR